MYNRKRKIYFVQLSLAMVMLGFFPVLFHGCKKDPVPNPYDPYNQQYNDSLNTDSLDPQSIQGLHKNIFKPNCANSGCHDGTFEPDFRTIESSYNSLVYHSIIKNDTGAPLSYRVEPGNANRSMIIERLTKDIDGISGIMPLVIEPESDWTERKNEYIEDIKSWINNGARDIFGNAPSSPNLNPQVLGFFVSSAGGSSPYPRNVNGVCEVPASDNNVDLHFAFGDDLTDAAALSINEIRISPTYLNFDTAYTNTMSIVPAVSGTGFDGSSVGYTHEFSISNVRALYPLATQLFVRVKIKDEHNPSVNIPSSESLPYIIQYFSFKLL